MTHIRGERIINEKRNVDITINCKILKQFLLQNSLRAEKERDCVNHLINDVTYKRTRAELYKTIRVRRTEIFPALIIARPSHALENCRIPNNALSITCNGASNLRRALLSSLRDPHCYITETWICLLERSTTRAYPLSLSRASFIPPSLFAQD